MSTDFRRLGPNNVESHSGFTVAWRPPGGIDYADIRGNVRIDAEVLTKPTRICLYEESVGLRQLSKERAEEILIRVIQALQFLGYQVER